MSGEDENEFSSLSLVTLAEAFLQCAQAAAATDDIGRQSQLAQQGLNILNELKARADARSVLEQLARHVDVNVRGAATDSPTRPARPAAPPAPEAPPAPLRPQIRWQPENPPPLALRRDEMAARLRGSLPQFCDRLMDMALPAIGLWPQRHAAMAPITSRFGGMPLAPPNWRWPIFEEEPLLFIGQINCAELRGLADAELLPSAGLLAFFGDYGTVEGADPSGICSVCHFADPERLVPALPPTEPLKVYLPCALVPRPLLELPHPFSHAVHELGLSPEEDKTYRDVWWGIHDHGVPRDCVGHSSFSKLLGWPDPLQGDLAQFQYGAGDARLLLQVDGYSNGEDLQSFGRGGSLYYVLPDAALRAHRFEPCELEGQFT
jgi:Domain of unknown function (DUF1963)